MYAVLFFHKEDKMERIESLANGRIKLAASLHQRRTREQTGKFIAEGVRLVETAVASSWRVDFMIVTDDALKNERVKSIAEKLEARRVPVLVASRELYKKAAATDTPQGVLCVMERRAWTMDDIAASMGTGEGAAEKAPLIVVLDGVQDPGNAGTILRTADAVGATGVIAMKGTTDFFSDKVVRSAMGSLFHLPVVTSVDTADLLTFVEQQSLSVFVTMLDDTARPHFDADFTVPSAIVFGNEGSGVSGALRDVGENIFIPMRGQTESLNVATSAAIVLYEAVRQRYYMSL